MVHAYTQDAIQLCDKKCGVLIALAGSVIAGLISAAGQSAPAHLVDADAVDQRWAVVAMTTLLAAIILAAISLKPRVWRDANQGSVFWRSIVAHRRPQRFAAYLRAQTAEVVSDHLAHQVYTLARICRRKYAWFGLSFYLAIAGALLTVIAVTHAQMATWR
jgi:hypothetical protein